MKQVTRRKRRKQAQAKRWVEIVALAREGVPKAEIARRVKCCRQTVYNVLAKAAGLPEGEAPVPRQPGPASGTGRRVSGHLRRRLCRWRVRWGRGVRYCQARLKLGLSPTTIERIWRQAGLLPTRAKRERP
jgi:hypothetical protein